MIRISVLKKSSANALDELGSLYAELHDARKLQKSIIRKNVIALLRNPDARLMVATDRNRIVGMAMLFAMQKIGSKSASVEDVIVSSLYRGHGIGEKLMKALEKQARKMRVTSIGLTSRPSRVAANKLYMKLGYKRRDTNAYKKEL